VAQRRVAVFIDYQNCRGAARESFCELLAAQQCGQFWPMGLAHTLADLGGPGYSLSYVGVYSGLPSSPRDPKTYGARRRQIAAWRNTGVTVINRPLRYPRDWPNVKAEEKGIDVKLAIDAVMMAVRREYDVGVIGSCDTDLAPAIEAILDLKHGAKAAIEVIAWEGRPGRIGVSGVQLVERTVRRTDFDRIRDDTDYNI